MKKFFVWSVAIFYVLCGEATAQMVAKAVSDGLLLQQIDEPEKIADRALSVTYFDHGKYETITAKAAQNLEIVTDQMIYEADSFKKKNVSDMLASAVKNGGKGIEIVYEKERQIAMRGQILYIDRILVPFCAQTECDGQTITFYLGRGTYFAPAYTVSTGGTYVDKLKQIIEKQNDPNK